MTDDGTRQISQSGTPDRSPTESEPVAAPPTPEPVATSPASGGNRARWAVGLGVAGIAVAVVIGAGMLLGGQPTPEALRYVPADAAVVVEVRMDLPGDQLQKVGNLLANFPGFQDQSTLAGKLDEALSRLVDAATDADVDFRADIKPWLNGPLFIAAEVPEPVATGQPVFLVSATTDGTVACDAVMEGMAVQAEAYRGLQIHTGTGPDSPLPFGDPACVVIERQVLLGSVASVKSGIDAKADNVGMDRSDTYRAARGALAGDQLATFFLDGEAMRGAMPMPSLGIDAPIPGLNALGGLGQVPDWLISGIRAEDDALVFDAVWAPAPAPTGGPSLLPLPATHANVVAPMAPANTVLLIEDQGTGVSIQNLAARLQAIPELAEALGILEAMGGLDELAGWITDVGVIVIDGDAPAGGVLLFAETDDLAADRYDTLAGFAGLMGLGGAGGIEVRRSTIAGVEVTTLVVTDLGSVVPPGGVPGEVSIPNVGPVEISFAARGRALVVGSGEAFMTAVLGVQSGASLADQDAYERAIAMGLGSSRTTVFVGLPATIELVEGFLPADALAEWTADVKPYLDPFEALIVTSSIDPSTGRSRVVITVGQ